MGREPNRQRDNGERWICIVGGGKHGAATDEEVAESVDTTARTHHTVARGGPAAFGWNTAGEQTLKQVHRRQYARSVARVRSRRMTEDRTEIQ